MMWQDSEIGFLQWAYIVYCYLLNIMKISLTNPKGTQTYCHTVLVGTYIQLEHSTEEANELPLLTN